jgi:hypothetical protein
MRVRVTRKGEAVMALTTLNLAVLPVVAGLIAGTGALATYATAPGNAPASVSTAAATVTPDAVLPAPAQAARPSPAPPAASSCDAQTWPFIDGSCTTKKAAGERKVRLVVAPRPSELPDSVPGGPAVRPHVPVPQSAVTPDQNSAPSGLTTSDTVLRSRDIVVPPPAKLSKREKRAEQRRERREGRWAAQSYSVPGEAYDRRVRPVIVVRPLRVEAYR